MSTAIITGTDTNVGKSLVSAAILTYLYQKSSLRLHYWKPLQTGSPPDDDTQLVEQLLGFSKHSTDARVRFHPNFARFPLAASPLEAAADSGVTIATEELKSSARHHISLSENRNALLVEGAGGVLVPIAPAYTFADFFQFINAPVILVSRTTLGTINHTLLSVEALKKREIPILGIFFTGPLHPFVQEYMLTCSQLPMLGQLEWVGPDRMTPPGEILPSMMRVSEMDPAGVLMNFFALETSR